MPLAGYPSESLYPAEDLYPGVASAATAIFRTPTLDVAYPMEGSLRALLPHAMSVWRIGGVWSQGFAPSLATVTAADRFYRGGYEHQIDSAGIAELTAAGYAAYIVVLEAS